jgi:hypothetical protein
MRIVTATVLLLAAAPLQAQARTTLSGGAVARPADARRLATQIPVLDPARRERARVTGDSAQRVAMDDFDWRGRVVSVELDENDERVYWDVKIVPDTAPRTVLRYRVDAFTAGILGIREFTDVAVLAPRRRP